jgi:hypothetical protein
MKFGANLTETYKQKKFLKELNINVLDFKVKV